MYHFKSLPPSKSGRVKISENKHMTTRVVRIRHKHGEVFVDCQVYIGRTVTRGGWNLQCSKWANPYRLGQDGLDRRRTYSILMKHTFAGDKI